MDYYNNYLMHYGVKGMKWGVRRKQNTDVSNAKSAYKSAKKDYKKAFNSAYNYSSTHPISQYVSKKKKAESDRRWTETYDKAQTLNKTKADYKTAKKNQYTPEQRAERRKKAVKVGVAVAGTALAAYGTYKASKFIKGKNAEIMTEKGKQVADDYLKNNIRLGSYSHNKNVYNQSIAIRQDYYNKAHNSSLPRATKNVYDYYRNKKK